jgi:hypothetical protein
MLSEGDRLDKESRWTWTYPARILEMPAWNRTDPVRVLDDEWTDANRIDQPSSASAPSPSSKDRWIVIPSSRSLSRSVFRATPRIRAACL